jgi:plastocyanin
MMGAMRAPLLCLAVCLVLAGCGSDKSSDTPPPPTQPVAGTTTGNPGPATNVVQVDMKDIKFVPGNVTVKVGQTVRWTNSDPVAHTVTATKGSDIDSGTVDPNQTYEAKFTKPGKVEYVCSIHPNQTGAITVTR